MRPMSASDRREFLAPGFRRSGSNNFVASMNWTLPCRWAGFRLPSTQMYVATIASSQSFSMIHTQRLIRDGQHPARTAGSVVHEVGP